MGTSEKEGEREKTREGLRRGTALILPCRLSRLLFFHSFPTIESVEQANQRLKLRNYGFSGEDVSAKLVDGEAQQGMPVVSSLFCLKMQNENLVS